MLIMRKSTTTRSSHLRDYAVGASLLRIEKNFETSAREGESLHTFCARECENNTGCKYYATIEGQVISCVKTPPPRFVIQICTLRICKFGIKQGIK